MKLLELAKKNLQEYISVKEVIELIARTQQTPISYVAVFLISQNFDTNISTYDVDRFFIVHSDDNFNWGTFQYTNSILSNLADSEYYKEAFIFDGTDLPENLANTYWKRKELYNLELIKNLSIDFYFRVQDIQVVAQQIQYDSKKFESKEVFSKTDVMDLLKHGITGYQLGNAEKYNLIDDFVFSSISFFDCGFDNEYEISRSNLAQLFSDNQIIIRGFNDNLNEGNSPIIESSTNEMILNINDENYLKIIEEESIYMPKIEIEVINKGDQNTSNNVIDLSLNEELNILIKSDYFDIFDSACLISLDEPRKLNCDINYGDDWNYGEHKQAVKVLNYAIKAQKLDEDDGLIPRASLQSFLFQRGYIIKGFNNHLKNEVLDQNSAIDQLKKENEKLKDELLKKAEEINQLEQDQKSTEYIHKLNDLKGESEKDSKIEEQKEKIEQLSLVNKQFSNEIFSLKKRISAIALLNDNQDHIVDRMEEDYLDLTPEQEISNSRRRNNVLKIISILSDMADLPLEHFVAFNMMDAYATQNSKEIPKKDTTADWLRKARDSN